jgi:hypothetical protein
MIAELILQVLLAELGWYFLVYRVWVLLDTS